MSIYTVDCKRYKLNDVDYSMSEDKTITSIDNKEMYLTLYIDCEDDEHNNSFNFEQYGDEGIVVERNRCELNVYINENKTPYDKNFTILCTHSNDKSVYIQINIVQIAEEYKLIFTTPPNSDGPNSILKNLKSIINNSVVVGDESNYNYYEDITIDVCVIGGSKKYRIENIVKCHEEPLEESDSPQYIYSPFDNGFIYTKKKDAIIIRNYGRPFLSEDDYYVITLCHEDYRQIKAEITLKYTNTRQRNNALQKNRKPMETTIPQHSNIYRLHNYIVPLTTEENKTETICQIIVNEHGENIQIQGECCKIIGQVDALLSFKVMEGDEITNLQPSNLSVRVKAFGNWCYAVSDEENTGNLADRKIKISILDKPMYERKTKIIISVVDYPDVYKSFILTNEMAS